MKKLLIWGKGGQAAVVHDAALALKEYAAIEHIDAHDSEGWANRFPVRDWVIHVAIGDNKARFAVIQQIINAGYNLATIIHPHAYIAYSASIGDGCFVGPKACVQVRTSLGTGVIVNTSASVDHDCVIGSCVHIAPGTHLCGSVIVGERTLLAAGSTVVPKIKIGNDCVLGAGSALIETIEGDNIKMWGVPARKVE